jgi:hypothetical protein
MPIDGVMDVKLDPSLPYSSSLCFFAASNARTSERTGVKTLRRFVVLIHSMAVSFGRVSDGVV